MDRNCSENLVGTRDGDRCRIAPACGFGVCWALWLLACGLAAPSLAATLDTATGLVVTIHSAEEIQARWLVREGGRTWLRHPVAGEVELDTVLHPWGELVPVSETAVAEAFATTRGFLTALQIEVFLLPGFPVEVSGSFARRDAIFMAPGIAEQAVETIAYLATHELGHVLCWAAVDGRPDRWSAYRELRGLPLQDASAPARHADRHREIIAEDIRFLFGGPLATRSGTIENTALPLPDAVTGLADLLAGYLAAPGAPSPATAPSRVYPNPCREVARVEVSLDGAADESPRGVPELTVYDVRGRVVRVIAGGSVANGRGIVVWDGTDVDGRRAAAGTYLYCIRCSGRVSTGRLVLVGR
ncbi:MAG TPA: FlgD immunoglobulin-like domain containing protein [Candidatus Krumholzibacteria bacterium]|nr:FlgD immunoglobulin-like domain containing protein [Candidatus Krumholzibacteria bacterium]HPD71192.1 FlgD immunoglobulin-like domain containing protein [Candidatus Krumholzibacteria bacterium]HRY39108.1 FlgD immunoglobulin-like domain containing protein [Candidatus Krumholzibacteria bacterium]